VVNKVYRVIVKINKQIIPRIMGKAKRLKLVFKNQTLLFILTQVAIYWVD
jgi:hypothetical protein